MYLYRPSKVFIIPTIAGAISVLILAWIEYSSKDLYIPEILFYSGIFLIAIAGTLFFLSYKVEISNGGIKSSVLFTTKEAQISDITKIYLNPYLLDNGVGRSVGLINNEGKIFFYFGTLSESETKKALNAVLTFKQVPIERPSDKQSQKNLGGKWNAFYYVLLILAIIWGIYMGLSGT